MSSAETKLLHACRLLVASVDATGGMNDAKHLFVADAYHAAKEAIKEDQRPVPEIRGIDLICPKCGGVDMQEYEDAFSYRDVLGVSNGTLYIAPDPDLSWESASNSRLACQKCFLEMDFPSSLAIDYESYELPEEEEEEGGEEA